MFFRFCIAVLMSAVHHETACIFNLTKKTGLAIILDNIINNVSK